MKHVLDQSIQAQSPSSLRHAYQGVLAKRPSQPTLQLQRRPECRITGAPMARQFLRIERGQQA